MDRKTIAIAALVVLAIGAYMYFSSMAVSPIESVFTGEGWSKYMEVNLPNGHPTSFYFEIPVQPDMKSDFSDVVVTDSKGRVLQKYSVAGAPVIGSYAVAYEYSLPYFHNDANWVVAVPKYLFNESGSFKAEFFGDSVSNAELYDYRDGSFAWSPDGGHVFLADVGPDGNAAFVSTVPLGNPGDIFSNVLTYSGGSVQPSQTFRGYYNYNEYPTQQWLTCLSSGYCLYTTHFATSSPDRGYVWIINPSGHVDKIMGAGYGYYVSLPKDATHWILFRGGDSYGDPNVEIKTVDTSGRVTTLCNLGRDIGYGYPGLVQDSANYYVSFYAPERGNYDVRIYRFSKSDPCHDYQLLYSGPINDLFGLPTPRAQWRMIGVSLRNEGPMLLFALLYPEGSGYRAKVYGYNPANGVKKELFSYYTPYSTVFILQYPFQMDGNGYSDGFVLSVSVRSQDSDAGIRYLYVYEDGGRSYVVRMDSSEIVPYLYKVPAGWLPMVVYGGAFTSGHDHSIGFFRQDGSYYMADEWYVSGGGCCGYPNLSAHAPYTVVGQQGDHLVVIAWSWWAGYNTWRVYVIPLSKFQSTSGLYRGQATLQGVHTSSGNTARVYVEGVSPDENKLYVFWGSGESVPHLSAWSDQNIVVSLSDPQDVVVKDVNLVVDSASFDGSRVAMAYRLVVDGATDTNHYYESVQYLEFPLSGISSEMSADGEQPQSGYTLDMNMYTVYGDGWQPQPIVLVTLDNYGLFRKHLKETYVLTAELPDLQPATLSLSATKTQLSGAEDVNVTINYPAPDAKCYVVDDSNRLISEVNYPTFTVLADAGQTVTVVCASSDYQPARASISFTGVPSGGGAAAGGGVAPAAPSAPAPSVQVAAATGSAGIPSWVYVVAAVAAIAVLVLLSRR